MKKWQKWLPVLAAIALLIGTALYFGNPKRQIRNYVLRNRADLDAFAEECLEKTPPLYDLKYDGHSVSVLEDYPDVVMLYWSGFGIAPSSRYYELYYAADGNPPIYPGMEDYTEVTKMFGWRWEERGGDNGCYVEHIDGNWYYVESWF